MAVDNVTFLICWFLIMFITISSGIFVIMYRVGCFKCTKKVGAAELDKMTNQQVLANGNNLPIRLCTACGEPLGVEDEQENTHSACRDMDAFDASFM